MKSCRAISQRGDTIVEVLLAMSVVGLVIGSSFGIANRSLRIGQSAKERTAALRIAESQIELLKTFQGTRPLTSQRADFCISTTPSIQIKPFNEFSPDPACFDTDGYGNDGLYTVRVEPPLTVPGSTRAYTIHVSWLRVGAATDVNDANLDTLKLYYKLGVL